jgi:alkylhydroperoxidase family enzyme
MLRSGGRRRMARIPLVEANQASPAVRAVFEKLSSYGAISNVMRVFASNPLVFEGFERFLAALYGSPRISPRYRELAYLRASQINHCHY